MSHVKKILDHFGTAHNTVPLLIFAEVFIFSNSYYCGPNKNEPGFDSRQTFLPLSKNTTIGFM